MVAAFLVKKFQASAVVADTEAAGLSWFILAQQQTRATQSIWFLYSSNSKLKHVGVGLLNQLTVKQLK